MVLLASLHVVQKENVCYCFDFEEWRNIAHYFKRDAPFTGHFCYVYRALYEHVFILTFFWMTGFDVYFAWIGFEENYFQLLISNLFLNTLIQNQLQMDDNNATN